MYTVEAPPAQVLIFSTMPKTNEVLLQNLAHELRQPLSTIESIAYYLEIAMPQADARVREQLSRLRHLVEQSSWILNDAVALARASSARPAIVDLDELVSEIVLEQQHIDPYGAPFDLKLAAQLVWMDGEQGRELVRAVCRLFLLLAKPGLPVSLETRVLASGAVLMRVRTEGNGGDDANLPPGANLTLERIERLAEENSASLAIRLEDPAQLELLLEVPAAPQSRVASAELEAALPGVEASAPLAPIGPGIV